MTRHVQADASSLAYRMLLTPQRSAPLRYSFLQEQDAERLVEHVRSLDGEHVS